MQPDFRDGKFSFSPLDNKETAIEQVFGIFDFPVASSNGRDYEEEAFQRQLKRRKKKKQQRRI
jgi:hypothetical protein